MKIQRRLLHLQKQPGSGRKAKDLVKALAVDTNHRVQTSKNANCIKRFGHTPSFVPTCCCIFTRNNCFMNPNSLIKRFKSLTGHSKNAVAFGSPFWFSLWMAQSQSPVLSPSFQFLDTSCMPQDDSRCVRPLEICRSTGCDTSPALKWTAQRMHTAHSRLIFAASRPYFCVWTPAEIATLSAAMSEQRTQLFLASKSLRRGRPLFSSRHRKPSHLLTNITRLSRSNSALMVLWNKL